MIVSHDQLNTMCILFSTARVLVQKDNGRSLFITNRACSLIDFIELDIYQSFILEHQTDDESFDIMCNLPLL